MSADRADPRIREATLTVRSYELDSFGHVNHAVFLNYFEYGRFEALRQAGFPYQRILSHGWGVYVVRAEIDYLAEAKLDDRLVVRTWPAGYRRSSLVFAQELLRAGDRAKRIARARVTTVWVGSDRRPMRIPEEVTTAIGNPIKEA